MIGELGPPQDPTQGILGRIAGARSAAEARRVGQLASAHQAAGDEAVRYWMSKRSETPLGFLDAVGELWERPAKLVPFVGSLETIDELNRVRDAAEAVEKGQASEEQEDTLRNFAVQASRERKFGYLAGSIVSELPAFAGEFALTSGAYAGAKTLAAGTIRRAIGKFAGKRAIDTAIKGAGALAGGAVQTALMPNRIVESTLRQALPRMGLSAEESNALGVTLEGSTQSFMDALPAGFSDALTEAVSERTGGIIPVRALQLASMKRWLAGRQGRTVADFTRKIAERTGWHGVLGEFAEERIGSALRAANPLLPDTWDQVWPGWRQAAAELTAFSVPGALANALPAGAASAGGSPQGQPTQAPTGQGPQAAPTQPTPAPPGSPVAGAAPPAAAAPVVPGVPAPAPAPAPAAKPAESKFDVEAKDEELRTAFGPEIEAAGGDAQFIDSIKGLIQLARTERDRLRGVFGATGRKQERLANSVIADAEKLGGAGPTDTPGAKLTSIRAALKLADVLDERAAAEQEAAQARTGQVVAEQEAVAEAQGVTPAVEPAATAAYQGAATVNPYSFDEEGNPIPPEEQAAARVAKAPEISEKPLATAASRQPKTVEAQPGAGRAGGVRTATTPEQKAAPAASVTVAEMPKGKQIGTDLTGEPVYEKVERGDIGRPGEGVKAPEESQIDLFAEEGGLFEQETRERDTGVVAETAPVAEKPKPVVTEEPKKKPLPLKKKRSFKQRLSDKAAESGSIQDFVASQGGIAFVSDMETLAGKDNPRKAFTGVVVHRRGSKKGQPWDQMLRAAVEAGFFPGKEASELGIDDLIDALQSDRLHPEAQARKAEEEREAYEAERAERDKEDEEYVPFQLTPNREQRAIGEALDAFEEDGDIEALKEALEIIRTRIAHEAVVRVGKRMERATKPRVRGKDWFVERLTRAKRQGELSEESVDLALWFIDQAPHVVDEAALSLRQAGKAVGGYYDTANDIVILAKGAVGGDSALSAAHEILHHTERMLPREVQDKLLDQWGKRLVARMERYRKEGNKELLRLYINFFMGAHGDTKAEKRAVDYLVAHPTLIPEHYQYFSPSEYWAENGARILSERKGETWVRAAKRWLRDFIERLKSILGLDSDHPVISALNQVLSGKNIEPPMNPILVQRIYRTSKSRTYSLVVPKPEDEGALSDTKRIADLAKAAKKSGEKTEIGTKPNPIAIITPDKALRAEFRAEREVRSDTEAIDPVSRAEQWKTALAMLGADYEGTAGRIFSKLQNGSALNAAETLALARITIDVRMRSKNGTPEEKASARWVYWWYQQARQEAGRALGVVRDALGKRLGNKVLTANELIEEALTAPTNTETTELNKLRKRVTDKSLPQSERDQVRKEIEEILAGIEKRAARGRKQLDELFGPEAQRPDDLFENDEALAIARRAVSTSRGLSWNWITEFGTAAMVSHPKTSIVSVLGNVVYSGYELYAKRAAEVLVNLAVRSPTNAQPGELLLMAHQMRSALVDAGRMALKSFKLELPVWELELEKRGLDVRDLGMTLPGRTLDDPQGPAIPGVAGRVIRVPLRSLLMIDTATKVFVAQQQAAALAYRQAVAEKLEPGTPEFEKRLQDLTTDLNSPIFRDLTRGAVPLARRSAYQGPDGPIGKIAFNLRKLGDQFGAAWLGGLPVGWFQLPFVRTPIQVFAAGTKVPGYPLWLLNRALRTGIRAAKGRSGPYSGQEGRTLLVEDLAGSVVAVGVVLAIAEALARAGDDDDFPLITGSEALQAGKRGLQRETVPAYSILWPDGVYRSYQFFDPLAIGIAVIVDAAKAYRAAVMREDSVAAAEALAAGAEGVASQFFQKTYMQSMGSLVDLLHSADPEGPSTPGKKLARIARDTYVIRFVPNIVRRTLTDLDPDIRVAADRPYEDEGVWTTTARSTGWKALPLRQNAPPIAYGIWGEKLTKASWSDPMLLTMLSPFRATKRTEDVHPLNLLVARYNQRRDLGLLGEDAEPLYPRPPDWDYKHKGVKHYWTNEEYSRLQREAGQKAAKRLLAMKLNMEEPGQREFEAIRKALRSARASVKERILREKRGR